MENVDISQYGEVDSFVQIVPLEESKGADIKGMYDRNFFANHKGRLE